MLERSGREGGGGGEFCYFGSIIDPLDMEQSLGAKVNTL